MVASLATDGFAVTSGVEHCAQDGARTCDQSTRLQKQGRQHNNAWRTHPVVRKRSQGMMAFIPGSILVWALLIAAVAPYSVSARPDDQRRPVIPSGGQEEFPDTYDQQAQEIAALLKIMQQVAVIQSRTQEDQWEDDLDPEDVVSSDQRTYRPLPVPLPLMRQQEVRTYQPLPVALPLIGQPEVHGNNADGGKEKRGYMSLCHFKICNMGRKRNLRWTPWARNSQF